MVKTADDILDIHPLERMEKLEEISQEKMVSISAKKKELEDLERTKRVELEELDIKKRREFEDLDRRKQRELDTLDKKRKEFEELETKKIREIEETQELIERSFQDLMRHKRILLQEDEERNKKSSNESMSLEEVANAAPKLASEIPNMNYGKFFENMQAPQRLYDITNNTFYNGLTDLRNRAASGQITPEEELFVARLKNQFEQFNSNESYVEKDQNQYIRRSIGIIDQIDKYQRSRND
jgi:hypothetical protein